MGQTSSRHAILTRTKSRPTGSNPPRSSKQSKHLGVVKDTDEAPKLRQATNTKNPSKYVRRAGEDSVSDSSPPPRAHTTSDRLDHHYEFEFAQNSGITVSRSLNSELKSRFQLSEPELHCPMQRQDRECMVCTDNQSISHFLSPTTRCGHDANICRRCLRAWISTSFMSRIWDDINCPTCMERLDYEDVRAFASSDVFHKYDKLCTKAALEAIPGFHWCIVRGCGSGQVHDEDSNQFRCVGCKKSHCIEHNILWHRGESCRDYDHRTNKNIRKEEERASQNLKNKITKDCPGCKRPIEKAYGCDHMTCTQCAHEFCWLCLAPYKEEIGYYRAVTHRDGCLYFGDNSRTTVWGERLMPHQ